MKKSLLILFYALVPFLLEGQVHNGITYQTNNNTLFYDVYVISEGTFACVIQPRGFSNEPTSLIKYDYSGNILNQRILSDTFLINTNYHDGKFVLLCQRVSGWPISEEYVIVLDSNLNDLTIVAPIKKNWPRSYFWARSYQQQVLKGDIGYFGVFFNNALLEAGAVRGWLQLSQSYDTLTFNGFGVNNDSIRIHSMYPGIEEGFFANGFTTRLSRPWSSTIDVGVIHKFDDSLNLTATANTFFNSPFASYPRILENTGMRNVLSNGHSAYVLTNFESASANTFSNKIYTFNVTQFDHSLNFKNWYHAEAIPGRISENNFMNSNLAFDASSQFIYAVGNHCMPSLIGIDPQDRLCSFKIIKLDTDLNLIWEKDIEIPNTQLQAVSIAATLDGGLLICGYKITPRPLPENYNAYVVKLDSAGNHSVSVPELAAEKPQVQLYPNPTSGSVHLHWQQGQYQRFGLFNLKGQQVYHSELDPGSNLHQLSLPNLPAGLYFYQLTGPSGTVSGKLVKQ